SLKDQIGKEATVEGVVLKSDWSHSGKVMNIVFASDGPNSRGLSCVIFASKRKDFDAAFGGHAAATFQGARLRLRGKLIAYGGYDDAYKGTAEIVLEDPQQVTIVEARPAHGQLALPVSAASKQAAEAGVCFKRGSVLESEQKLTEAAMAYTEAIRIKPTMVEA